jgi:hypothetical protein
LTGGSSIEKKRNNYFSNEPAAITSFSKDNRLTLMQIPFEIAGTAGAAAFFRKKNGRDG